LKKLQKKLDEENAGNTANNGMNPMEIMMMSQMGGGMGGMGGVGMTDPSMMMPAASVANDLTSGGKDLKVYITVLQIRKAILPAPFSFC